MLRTWFYALRRKARIATKSPRHAAYQPRLESLEDRLVPATLTVGPTSTYHTITAAVNVANSGDVINVNPGTYQEQVVIPSTGANHRAITKLTLEAVSGQPLILAPASMTSGNQPIVDINGATGVVIKGFQISGQTAGAYESAGVYIEGNGAATITTNHITHIQTNNESGVGVLIGNTVHRVPPKGAKATAVISQNIIDNYGKAGIADVNGSTATISQNIITGSGTSSPVLQYGIEIGSLQAGDGAGGTISQNIITGNLSYDPNGYSQAAAILVYNEGAVTSISNNVLGANANALPNGTTVPFSNDVGIWVFSAANTTISNNDICETKYEGIELDELTTVNTGLKVTNNDISYSLGDGMLVFNTASSTFSNNDLTNNGQSGLWLGLNDTGNTFSNNSITANGAFGILVADYDPNSPSLEAYLHSSTSTGNTLKQNSITGNDTSHTASVYDAEDFSTGAKTAHTANTWSGNSIGTKNPTGLQ